MMYILEMSMMLSPFREGQVVGRRADRVHAATANREGEVLQHGWPVVRVHDMAGLSVQRRHPRCKF